MKTITFFTLCCLSVFSLNAQEEVYNTSFEASEGFTLDTINGQNGWMTQSDFSKLFYISEEKSSEGSYALKGLQDSENVIPTGGIVPAISPEFSLGTPDSLKIDFDYYLSSEGITSRQENISDFEMFIYGEETGSQLLITARVAFVQGHILVETTDPSDPEGFVLQDAGPFDYDTFFNVEMKLHFDTGVIDYFLDGTHFFSGDVFSGTTMTRFGFFTNGVDVFYADNITMESYGELGVNSFDKLSFQYFQDQNHRLHLSAKQPIQHVGLYNLLGQQVIDQAQSNREARVDLSGLNPGVYLVKVQVNNQINSFKIVKDL